MSVFFIRSDSKRAAIFLASRCAAKGSEMKMGGAGECADALPVTPANHVADSEAHGTALKDSLGFQDFFYNKNTGYILYYWVE